MRIAALAAAFVLASATLPAAQTLRGPFDVETSRARHGVRLKQAPCAALASPVRDVEAVGFYTDAKHSIVDPERYARNQAATKPLRDLTAIVTRASDDWMRSQSADAAPARCALEHLVAWADSGAMLGRVNDQGGYERKWTLAGLALAYLKIRDAPGLDAGARRRVEAWLVAIARAVQPGYERANRVDARNNHRYWAGLAVAAAGVAADDRALFEWGLASGRIGLAQIAPDGTLPLELARGSKAAHYHLFAAAPLMLLAELAQANGIDFHAEFADRQGRGALRRLADRALDAAIDPGFFAAATQQPQDFVGRPNLSWLEVYAARFPAPALERLAQTARPIRAPWLGGDQTLAFAR